jgi:hypothetical protein
MPFTPLPAIFSADLASSGSREVLELGSGDGAFTEVLREFGAEPVTMDRGAAVMGIRAQVRGDALSPPFRRRFDVVVAANLLRHLWREVAAAGPTAWRDLVAPRGVLWILEDEPVAEPAPARHYRDLQAFLARLDPEGRGPLLARRRFEARARSWNWPGAWSGGEEANAWPVAGKDVAAWLAAGVTTAGGEVDRLAGAIRREGLSYGRFWWARWQAEDMA